MSLIQRNMGVSDVRWQRVMPGCIFILSRFILRVDNVLFRMFDTRMYHSFSSSLVLREVSGWEAPYERVKRVSKSYLGDTTVLTCYGL
jgi:hypothetical protein